VIGIDFPFVKDKSLSDFLNFYFEYWDKSWMGTALSNSKIEPITFLPITFAVEIAN
jgi:hypothetical protein